LKNKQVFSDGEYDFDAPEEYETQNL